MEKAIFWNRVRLEPLSTQQALYARYQDSLYQVMRSESYRRSMDRVLNKGYLEQTALFRIISDHKTTHLGSAAGHCADSAGSLWRTPGQAGWRPAKDFPSKRLEFERDVSYGFRNGISTGPS